MDKATRNLVQRAKRFEAKVQTLAFDGEQGARKERMKMLERRHWKRRREVGVLETGAPIETRKPSAVSYGNR